ncbi:hypothetical protein NBRC116594_02950 [Shimia sp. NS0008-38b]
MAAKAKPAQPKAKACALSGPPLDREEGVKMAGARFWQSEMSSRSVLPDPDMGQTNERSL